MWIPHRNIPDFIILETAFKSYDPTFDWRFQNHTVTSYPIKIDFFFLVLVAGHSRIFPFQAGNFTIPIFPEQISSQGNGHICLPYNLECSFPCKFERRFESEWFWMTNVWFTPSRAVFLSLECEFSNWRCMNIAFLGIHWTVIPARCVVQTAVCITWAFVHGAEVMNLVVITFFPQSASHRGNGAPASADQTTDKSFAAMQDKVRVRDTLADTLFCFYTERNSVRV